MPSTDITYCNNKNCEIKKDCKRELAKILMSQVEICVPVAHFVPHYDESGVKCDMFIKKESKQ